MFIWASCAHLYSLGETLQPPPFPRHLGEYTRALLVSQDRDDISLWIPARDLWTPVVLRKEYLKKLTQNVVFSSQG